MKSLINRFYTPTWIVIFGMASLCILSLPAIVFGVKEGFDIGVHISWYLSFKDAMKAGFGYPRWFSDQNEGLGSPFLFFYPPFTNYFFFLIDRLTAGLFAPDQLVAAASLVLGLISAGTFYIWVKNFIERRTALCLAFCYALVPYHFLINFYVRGDFAEYAAYIWPPLIFHGIYAIIVKGRWGWGPCLALSIAGLFFTHLLTAMVVGPAAAAYMLWLLAGRRAEAGNVKNSILLVLAAITGMGLAALYYVPALQLMEFINVPALHQWKIEDSFVYKAFGNPSRWDYSLFKTAVIVECYFALALYMFFENRRAGNRANDVPFWMVLSGLLYLFMNGAFGFMLHEPSPYTNMQFVWRAASMAEFAVITMAAVALSSLKETNGHRRLVIVLSATMAILLLWQAGDIAQKTRGVRHKVSAMHYMQVENRISPPEYTPAGVEYGTKAPDVQKGLEKYKGQPVRAAVVNGTAVISSVKQNGNAFVVNVAATTRATVSLYQFYFPGWVATDENHAVLDVVPATDDKLASFTVPPGAHVITVSRGATDSERLGRQVSMAAFIVFIILSLVCWLHTGRRRMKGALT